MRWFSLLMITIVSPFQISHSSLPTEDYSGYQTTSQTSKDAPAVFLDLLQSYPHYFQRDTLFGGFEYTGRVYCGPVAVSNALIKFYNSGHTGLFDDTGDEARNQYELIKLLGSSHYFNTGNRGTGPYSISKGLERFFNDRNISGVNIKYQGWRTVPLRFSESNTAPDINEMKNALRNNQAVLLNFGWYRYDKVNNVYERTGGHWVTLAGYGHDGKGESPSSLVIRDPGRRNRPESYVAIEQINSGTLKGSLGGLPADAQGYYRFRHTRRRYGIIDGIVIVEMPEKGLFSDRG